MHRANAVSHLIAVLGMAVASAAFAADEPTAPPASSPATAAAPQPQICRDRLRPGSHIATRTCSTTAQRAVRSWPNGMYRQGGLYDSLGAWGQVSTAAQSVGASAFTAR